MGRKKRSYKITSIILHAGNEVENINLNPNEEFEISKNEINKIMNRMKKRIDSIIESKKYNKNPSNLNSPPIDEKINNQNIQVPDEPKCATAMICDNLCDDNFNIPFTNYSNFKIEKADNIEKSDKNNDELFIKDIISIKKTEEHLFDQEDNGQFNFLFQQSPNDKIFSIIQDKSDKKDDTSDYKEYLATLNNLFEINNQSK